MATDYDSLWDSVMAIVDPAVDGTVGDKIRYAIDGTTFTVIPGFVFDDVQGETSYESNDDDFDVRKRVKISKALIGDVSLAHRLQHPRLGAGTFRPTNSVPQSEGRYWLFEVQKV